MRKAQAKKLPLAPDPKFNDKNVTRFVNCLMWGGNKTIVLSIFYDALDKVEAKLQERGIDVWKKALNNIMPSVEVKARRVGGSTFQIPIEVPADRKVAVGMKWLILYARRRSEKSMSDKLAAEIIAASKNEGASVKKREDTHKMADANKAFSHFKLS
jgi:small subunit ribosomal protein S7